MNLNYTITSKRKLLQLVEEGFVKGWDDPRMPTLSGLRRRGYTPESIRNFSEKVGVAKRDNTIDIALLEYSIREDLNKNAMRVMGVLHPLKLIIDNYPENQTEKLEAINNPEDQSAGTREITFSKVLFIEQDDFMEEPPKKYFRLFPGNEVRLRYAYIIKCTDFKKDESTGEIKEVHCIYYPETKSGSDKSGRKVKGTIHWVSAESSINAEVRLYDRLFNVEDPEEDKNKDFKEFLNPNSLLVLKDCILERSLEGASPGNRYQFERQGYFCVDSKDSQKGNLVFNRIVPLRDTWSKIANK